MDASMSQSPARLTSVQALRGLAALWVLLLHVGIFSQERCDTIFLGDMFRHGRLGVDCFFVISGFIICLVHRRDIGVPAASRRYVLRRFIRVYPLLFLANTIKVTYLLAFGYGIPPEKKSIDLILSSFLMLPHSEGLLIAVAWTLSHEALFYGVFLLLIILYRRWACAIIALWVLGIVCLGCCASGTLGTGLAFLFKAYNLEFIMGMLAAVLLQHGVSRRQSLLAIVLGVGLLAAGIFWYDEIGTLNAVLRRVYWGTVFSLIVLGACAVESRRSLKLPRVVLLLGDASYSVYLFHTSFLDVSLLAWTSLMPAPKPIGQLTLVAIGMVALLGSIAIHLVLERPVLSYLRQRIQAREQTAAHSARMSST
jgi:exopolysaccharide production protein ExoZ